MARKSKPPGVVIQQQVRLARALHSLGDRRATQKLVDELLPELERVGLRGIAHELRTLVAS